MAREPVEIIDVWLEERLEHPVPGLAMRAGRFPEAAMDRE